MSERRPHASGQSAWPRLKRALGRLLTEAPPREQLKKTKFAQDGRLGGALRSLRHPLRWVTMVLATWALIVNVAPATGLYAALAMTPFGLLAGGQLSKTSLRLPWLLALAGLTGWLGTAIGWFFLHTQFPASTLGTSTALTLGSVARYGFGALALHSVLRATAKRTRWGLALEGLFVVVAVAFLFSAHRDGIIARPLWLSDWAWRRGIDPADVFLYLGAGTGTCLALLLLLEHRSGRIVSSLLALPLLALLAVACLDVVGRPAPQPEDGIGLTTSEQGEPPPPLPTHPTDPPGGGQQGEDDDSKQNPSGGDSRDGGVPETGQEDGGSTGLGDAGGSQGAGDASSGSSGDQDAGTNQGGAEQDGGVSEASSQADGGSSEQVQDGGADTQQTPSGGSSDQQNIAENQPPPNPSEVLHDDQPPEKGSAAPLAVVVFDTDYSPPAGAYYFRQEAWSSFTGSRLIAAEGVDGADEDVLDAFPEDVVALTPPPDAGRQEVKGRAALLVDHQHPFALETPIRFEPSFNPNPERFARTYRFESLAQKLEYRELLGRKAGNPEWSDALRDHYLVTHPDPRFEALAKTIVEEGELPEAMRDDPFARALALKLWLDKNLIYSTKERHANVPDPTIDFLFGNRTGYCVHFAHASVFLLREVGIPARVGTGYMVAEENRRGGSAVLLRSNDAHAWPEMYLDGVGWIVFDIAAETNLDEPGEPLDEDLQRMLGEMARDQPPDPADEIRNERRQPSALWLWLRAHVWQLLLALVATILLALYGIKVVRRIGHHFASKKRLPISAYRCLLDQLAEVGLSREFGETREAFAARVTQVAPSFGAATSMLVQAQLSRPSGYSAPCYNRAQWRSLRRQGRREIRSQVRWWRRLLGLLHPVSFLNAK